MFNSKLLAVAALLAFAGAAQALDCSCAPGSKQTTNNTQLVNLLTNRMVCANVGNEKWQEHHNPNGKLWDYKLGPTDTRDPSAEVGTYSIANNLVTYNYGSESYTYAVCAVGTSSYTFCGQRTISGAKVGGSGLTSCAGVSNIVQLR
jgi:hypothetical protein